MGPVEIVFLALIIAAAIMFGTAHASRADRFPTDVASPEVGTLSQPPAVLRKDLRFGYYGSIPSQIDETSDHVNVHMIWGWGGNGDWLSTVIADMKRCKELGVKEIILGLPQSYGAPSLASQQLEQAWQAMRDAQVLDMVKYLYPIDEPDIADNGPKTNEQVESVNLMVRGTTVNFPELYDVKLMVIYGGSDGYYPGLATYDIIGIDDYGRNSGVLEAYQELKKKLQPGQQLVLVPGGATMQPGGQENPFPYYNYANNDPLVWGILAFIWFDNWDQKHPDWLGIKSNGLSPLYRAMGNSIKKASEQ